ncbi:alpha/beta hydrolase-fold protein [Parapedobacter sp. DT-150]|uniref:alpha/beta hydrolase-fold protein n=1 Tax=Parapedobacter sp. DT-150 TaxID=3396162 RepID=UPI003F1B8292
MRRIIVPLFLVLVILEIPAIGWSQLRLSGQVLDADSGAPLAYVNIGIKDKNIGTVSMDGGAFTLHIPEGHEHDTLTFSLVGYQLYHIPVNEARGGEPVIAKLAAKNTLLNEVVVSGRKPVERRYGIKTRNLLLHFTDGMFEPDDSFEIGQLIKLGETPAKITSLNLYVFDTREDSATFRINFYRYADGRPAERLVEESILQRHALNKGWLRFDLTEYDIRLTGAFVACLEFMPETGEQTEPIAYEVKLGGTSKSFYRRSSLGTWNTPPHHYCLYVTALVDRDMPEEVEDIASAPTLVLPSSVVNDEFSLFIQLPPDYGEDTSRRYPVLYHLDGNAYFDHVGQAVHRQTKDAVEPIVIGIGYENAYVMDSLRVRDYTFPAASPHEGFATSGGADRFYDFLQSELIPYVDQTYRTDTTSRAIMGHSFGGYFVLYALWRDRTAEDGHAPVFDHYVAASPSIGYQDNYIIQQLTALPVAKHGRDMERSKLLLTMGEREMGEGMAANFQKLIHSLSEKPGITVRAKVYQDMEHMGTAVPSFEAGIGFICQ